MKTKTSSKMLSSWKINHKTSLPFFVRPNLLLRLCCQPRTNLATIYRGEQIATLIYARKSLRLSNLRKDFKF